MKTFDVTYVDPIRNRLVTALQVPADRLRQNNDGELLYRYNDYYASCEVVTAKEVKPLTSEQVTMNGRFGCE